MALNFPNSPVVGQLYQPSTSDYVYRWDGEKWVINQTIDASGDLLSHNGTRPAAIGVGSEGQVLYSRPSINGGIKLRWETPASSPFDAGDKIVFGQNTVPTGWTLKTNSLYNNAAIKIQNTAGGVTGYTGSAFTTVFGANKRTENHSLTVAQMPEHNHGVTGNYKLPTQTQATNLLPAPSVGTNTKTFASRTFSTQGNNSGHQHDINLNVKYVACVVGSFNG